MKYHDVKDLLNAQCEYAIFISGNDIRFKRNKRLNEYMFVLGDKFLIRVEMGDIKSSKTLVIKIYFGKEKLYDFINYLNNNCTFGGIYDLQFNRATVKIENVEQIHDVFNALEKIQYFQKDGVGEF